jgi:hypothetical protein
MRVRPFAMLVFWTAVVMYTAVGIAGIVIGPFEIAAQLPRDPTALGQVRFLKAFELAAGVGFFALRHRVRDDLFAQRFVAFVLWVTPIARLVAMAAEGLPSLPFQVLAGFEVFGAVIFSAYVFETRRAVTAS